MFSTFTADVQSIVNEQLPEQPAPTERKERTCASTATAGRVTSRRNLEEYVDHELPQSGRSLRSCWTGAVWDGLIKCGLVKGLEKIVHRSVISPPFANVNQDRPKALATVHGYLNEGDIRYYGR